MIICVYKGFVMWFLKWDYESNSLNETILAIITAKRQRIDAFKLKKTLENPLDGKEIKPGNSKGNQPWIFTGRTDTEAEAPVLWPPDVKSQIIGKNPDAGKDWGQEKRVTEDEMVGWHHQLNGREFEQTCEGQGSLAHCSPLHPKGSDTTKQLNNNKKWFLSLF